MDGKGSIRVGCSGWSYRDWPDAGVYPAGSRSSSWFGHYAEMFDTVELNTTFYRLPTAAAVEHWHDQAPPGFCYAVKVGQFGTHRKKLLDPEPWLARHLERAELLGPTMGPHLFQLPPRWRRSPARLDELLTVAPDHIRWAVEVRDASWLHDDVYEVLARHGAALCIHDLLADHPWELTTDWTYVRFHGPNAIEAPYRGRYGPEGLAPMAEKMAGWLDGGADVYAYFNNDYEGNAVVDAVTLRHQLAPVHQT